MRTMYDSVTLTAIPAGATMVAGYVDGRYANMPAIRQKWPHAVHVTITVTGASLDAQVVDCEMGDATPAHAAAWAKQKLARGQHPTIYCNASTWPQVRTEVARLGLTGKVSYWIAQYDNKPMIPAGAVAKQYHSTSKPNLDTSVVADYWPGVDPAPKPAVKATAKPAPAPAKAPAKAPAAKPTPAAQTARARARASLLHRLHCLHLARLLRLRRR